MHKSPEKEKLCVSITKDARRQLEEWARLDLTSLSTEVLRSIRMRAEREAREKVAG